MSETSYFLDLPYIMPSQAQKHVTHNEAIRMIDAIAHLSVAAIGVNVPPGDPEEGMRVLIGDAPEGEWADRNGNLAARIDGAWMYFTPRVGWMVLNEADQSIRFYDGSHWLAITAEVQSVPQLGINGQASESERLVVQSQSMLFNHDGGDLRVKFNKADAGNTVSFIMQSGFAGRAELGLMGEDNFAIKVASDDGSWREAIRIDNQTGRTVFPANEVELTAGLQTNLLPDSGRFVAHEDQYDILSSIAQMPDYLIADNGSGISFPHQFIDDNTTHGGSRGVLDGAVTDLASAFETAEGSRHGPEFWLMIIDAGSGTSSALTINGEMFSRQIHAKKTLRPGEFTTGFYVFALAGKCCIHQHDGTVKRVLRDGTQVYYWTDGVVVSPEDGWVYFETQTVRAARGYEENDLSVSMTSTGSAYLALPRVVAGHVRLGKTSGMVANQRVFEG